MRAEKRQDRQHLIQDEALALFASRGFAATTMGQIARAAGLGTGTLYNYYPTKADLLLSVVADRAPSFVAQFPRARIAVLATHKLDALLDVYLESFSAIGRSTWRDLLAIGLTSRPDLFAQLAKIDAPFVAELAACLRELRNPGDPQALAQALYHTLIGTIVLWLGTPDGEPETTLPALRQTALASMGLATRQPRPTSTALAHQDGE